VPDWLAAINPVEKKISAPSKPVEEEVPDFFAQFNQPVQQEPAKPAQDNLSQGEAPSLMADSGDNTPADDMAGWLSQNSEQPSDLSHSDPGISPEPPIPAQPEDLGWLHDLESSAKQSTPSETSPSDMDWMSKLDASPAPTSGEQDDMSWLNNLSGIPVSPTEASPSQPASSQNDMSWLNNLGGIPEPASNEPESSQPASSQEDMSWLNNLGGEPTTSSNESESSQPVSSQEDMSWLNNLSGTPAPSSNESESSQPASSQDDMSWLNNLGGTTAPSSNESETSQPASSQEDMSWLNNLGDTPASSIEEPTPSQTASSQEDLSWLNTLGTTPLPPVDESLQASSLQPEDTDWLKSLDNQHNAEPTSSGPLSPRQTAPLSEEARNSMPDWLKSLNKQQGAELTPSDEPSLSPRQTAPLSEEARNSMPDWLKSATAEPSMPPLGGTSMDWFTSKDQQADEASLNVDNMQNDLSASQTFDLSQGMPAALDQNISSSASDSSALSNQDVDSLFAVDMPDWLSQPEPQADVSSLKEGNLPSESDDSLAPVNLPSWVQAMRPVEAAIGEASAVSPDQSTEREGPLAGFRGVIPFAPIGSAQRPKAISLKLQATDEQQASASLLEQILASETTPRALKTTPLVVSQRVLRWVLSGLFVIVLGVMIGLGSQIMPVFVSPNQMIAINDISDNLLKLTESASVLVVIDYEPALAGEMEAVAGPLLDRVVILRHPNFTFISTSPNGSGLVERLMANTKINQSAPVGLGYQIDSQYFNIGYLPGGSAGVRGFTESPKVLMPTINVDKFSDFATVVVITDHAESGLVWIEQLEQLKQTDPILANQPLLVVASAQAGPLLQPYVSSKQVAGMISGLSDAAQFEFVNNSRPGIARSYWDAFGVGLFMAIISIILGSLWSLFTGIRARRTESGQG